MIGQKQTPLTAYHTAGCDKLVSKLIDCSEVNLLPYESHQQAIKWSENTNGPRMTAKFPPPPPQSSISSFMLHIKS